MNILIPINVHKMNILLRSAASFCNSPTRNIHKFLNNMLTAHLNFKPKYNTSSTAEFIEKVNDMKINNAGILVSVEVKNLFASIPVNKSVTLINESLCNLELTRILKI